MAIQRKLLPLVAIAISLAVLDAPAVHSQIWRTMTASRQRGSADSLHVRVYFGAGTFNLAAATDPLLYDLDLRYDAGRVRPMHKYDASTGLLTIRSDSAIGHPFSLDMKRGGLHLKAPGDDRNGTDLAVGLARGVPLDLSLSLGACDATLDLSNLSVRRLQLESGASQTTVTFGTPNPVPMSSLEMDIGAAGLTVKSLGNAHASKVAVTTGVGGADLDLGGAWTGTMHVTVRAALGGISLHVPDDVGIEARVSKTLGSLDAPDLTSRDGAYYSANWGTATRKVVIDATATLAGLEITRD
ncbi:MAG TPA: hypothetical protein VJO52_08780 [Gemmatimonadaceae bacterium]|nr:hypothetical protein [Gemmatimonadaceae bacterium]